MGQSVLHDALLPQAEKLGVEVRTLTTAIALHQDADGAINGVTIRDEASQETQDVATGAVVLAAGGYLNNPDMMAKLTQYDTSRLIPVSSGKEPVMACN